MLAGAAPRLPSRLRLAVQSLPPRAIEAAEQLVVKRIAQSGNAGDEGAQRGRRVVGRWTATTEGGGHQHGAGHDGPGLKEVLVPVRGTSCLETREQGVE